MSDPKLTDFKVLVFDVYGTLVDWETGIYNALLPLLSRYPAAKWSRSDALTAFEAVEKDIQTASPEMLYADVLAKAHAALEARLNALYGKDGEVAPIESVSTTESTSQSSGDSAHVAFGKSIKDWKNFADSSQALHDLSKHYKLVVLSNVDRASFAHTHAKLSTGDSSALASPLYSPSSGQYWFPRQIPESQSPFSLILTAQDVHSYKPALPGFVTTLEVIQRDLLDGEDAKSNVLWVAQSLFHDVEPAHRLGIRSVWINRKGASMGSDEGNKKYTWSFRSLGEMAEAVQQEAALL